MTKNLFIAVFFFNLLLSPNIVFGYIDPGSGLPFLSSLSVFAGIFLAFLAIIFYPAKILIKTIGKKFFSNKTWKRYIIFAFFLIFIIIITYTGVKMIRKKDISLDKKVLVIGIDALAPDLLEKYISEGKLPNFKTLIETGSFSRLGTSNPPQSPVAWSSFATGMHPGNHGLFDFISRNQQNYLPQLQFTEIKTHTKTIKIGDIKIPIGKTELINNRKGTPFWVLLSEANIPSVIIHCPVTFPPDKIKGRMLSGMGTPDIRGTEGTFAFFTTAPLPEGKDIGGKVIKVDWQADTIETELPGPVDTSSGKIKEFSLPLKIVYEPESSYVEIKIQKHQLKIKEKEWSIWIPLKFKLGLLKNIHGICRFYLRKIKPELELYCTPINFNHNNTQFPISYPKKYAKELVKKIGYYYTQGTPFDTWAVNENRMDDSTFLQLAEYVFDKNKEIFWLEFSRFEQGLLFNYFEALDIIQHMFWRFIDKSHPVYKKNEAKEFEHVIESYYKKMDDFVGEVLSKIDKNTILIILSDHGFGTFRRACHINTWLRQNGFLYLNDDTLKQGRELLQDVDWSRTKAYSLGFGSIYVNQRGREGNGIVAPGGETEELKQEIKNKISKWIDPKHNKSVMKKVYTREEIFFGKYASESPDLLCGFAKAYRASWQTAIGGVPENLIEDNLKKWSGDHLFDASEVPASLLSNKPIKKKNSHIVDLAPTILSIFRVPIPKDMDGKNIF